MSPNGATRAQASEDGSANKLRAQAAEGGSANKLRAQAAEGGSANKLRGEASLPIAGRDHLLRPTFDALVRAEEELGPLFALVERAGAGQLKLAEIAALFWHCLADRAVPRERVGEAVMALGLARCTAPLRVLLGQILKGAE